MDVAKIGKTLIRLRGGERREVVAAALGISLSALCMYETGKRVPRDEIKIAIADYYNSTVESIFFSDSVTNRDNCPERTA